MTDQDANKSSASGVPKAGPEKSFMELVTDWERGFDSFANQFMGTETYSAWINQMQKTRLQAQKSFGDLVSQQLETLNVPSREDVVRLAENVRKMDRRLERIESALTKLVPEEQTVKANRPRRTRKPGKTSDDHASDISDNSDNSDNSDISDNADNADKKSDKKSAKKSDKKSDKKSVKKSTKKSSAERN